MLEKLWYLKNNKVFEDLTEISQISVASNSRIEEHPTDETIVFQGDRRTQIFLVISGRIELSHSAEDGRKIIIAHLVEGDIWGPLDDSDDPAGEVLQARTILPTDLMIFDREYFLNMLERRPRVAIRLNRMMGLRQKRYELRLVNLLFKNNLQKLASLLLELGDAYGEDDARTTKLGLDLSHEELGSMIGISREQITRLLGDLCLREAITSRRRNIRIIDRDLLLSISGSASESFPRLFGTGSRAVTEKADR